MFFFSSFQVICKFTFLLGFCLCGVCSYGGCKFPTYCGPTCQIQCQDGCVSQHCNQSCDCVNGCNRKYRGYKCQYLCSSNCNIPVDTSFAICDNFNGRCFYGCKENKFWDTECEKPCSNGCVHGTCKQDSGNCTEGCASTTVYGWQCDMKCNENCIGGTCERADGYCDKGCNKGSYGDLCDKKCNQNCVGDTCKRGDGYCDSGCLIGLYGDKCDLNCNIRCLDNKCERNYGNCTDGCISGYAGINCNMNINRYIDPYRQQIRITEDGKNNWMGAAISGWLCIVILLVAVLIMVIRRKYKNSKGRTNTTNDEQPPIRSEPNVYLTWETNNMNNNLADTYETLQSQESTADRSHYENSENVQMQ